MLSYCQWGYILALFLICMESMRTLSMRKEKALLMGQKYLGYNLRCVLLSLCRRNPFYIEHLKLDFEHDEYDKKLAKNLQCIDAESCLYSNVNSIDAAKNRILTVLRKVKLVSKSEFTKYIVLKVEYNNDSSLFDLEKIQGIENFISSYKKTK